MRLRLVIAIATLVMVCGSVCAQTSLKGRVYHHPNIMTTMFEHDIDVDKEVAEAKKKSIAEAEKKKGRKLTQAELNELNKDLAKKKGEIKKKVEEVKNAIVMAMTIEFTSATDAVIKMNGKVNEDALKRLGIGWMKRKALKTYISMTPERQDVKYEVNGNQVILIDKKERDTMTLGNDGNTLSGVYNKDTKFTLKRTK